MRLLLDVTPALRQGAGIGRYARELTRALLELEDRPFDLVLWAAAGRLGPEGEGRRREMAARARAAGVPFRTVPLSEPWLTRLWQRLRLPLPAELLAGPVDLWVGLDFVLPPRLRARGAVLIYDTSYLDRPGDADPALVRYLSRAVPRTLRRADRLFTLSRFSARRLREAYGLDPARIVPLGGGVDLARFRPRPADDPRVRQALAALGLAPGYVLTVGTLEPRKNHALLIEAWGRLPPSRPPLVIAGRRGWRYGEVRRRAARLDPPPRFLEEVPDDLLPYLYNGAALFAFPSRYEGWGLPLLEGMASGLACLAADAASLPEILGEAGERLPAEDPAPWTEALARLLGDPERRRALGQAARARAQGFTWRRVAERFVAAVGPWLS